MTWTLYGPDALLFQFAEDVGDTAFDRGRAIVAELEKRPPAGMLEFVPGFTTVLIEFDGKQEINLKKIAGELAAQLESAAMIDIPIASVKEIQIAWDGPDLARVAQVNRLRIDDVKEIFLAKIYRVYLLGFSPGFPYLGDLDRRLHTPRLAAPRPRVSAGSIAIGGEHTGIYTVESPGGWNIIGHTRTKIFDLERTKAGQDEIASFFLKHGDQVKFIPTPD